MPENQSTPSPFIFTIGEARFSLFPSKAGLQIPPTPYCRTEDELVKLKEWMEVVARRDHYKIDLTPDQISLIATVNNPKSWDSAANYNHYIKFAGVSDEKQELLASQLIETLKPYAQSLEAEKQYIAKTFVRDEVFSLEDALVYALESNDRLFEETVDERIKPSLVGIEEKRIRSEKEKATPRDKAEMRKKPHKKPNPATIAHSTNFDNEMRRLGANLKEGICIGLQRSGVQKERIEDIAMQIAFGAEPEILEPIFRWDIKNSGENQKLYGRLTAGYYADDKQRIIYYGGTAEKNMSIFGGMMDYAVASAIRIHWPDYPQYTYRYYSLGWEEGKTVADSNKVMVLRPLLDEHFKVYQGSMPAMMATVKAFLMHVGQRFRDNRGEFLGREDAAIDEEVIKFQAANPIKPAYDVPAVERELHRRLGFLLPEEGMKEPEQIKSCKENIMERISGIMQQYAEEKAKSGKGGRRL